MNVNYILINKTSKIGSKCKNKLKKKNNIFSNRDLIFFKIKFENLSNIWISCYFNSIILIFDFLENKNFNSKISFYACFQM